MSKESYKLLENRLYKATIAMQFESAELLELPLERIYPEASIDPHNSTINANIALLNLGLTKYRAETRKIGSVDKSILVAGIAAKLIK